MNSPRVILVLSLLIGSQVASADHHEQAQSNPMEALAWLAGEWEGGGWTMTGPGQRAEFLGTESVESRLGGRVLVVEGRHFEKDDPEHPVHQALAVISYDAQRRNFRFQAHAVGRPGLDATGVVEDGAFVWSMDIPGGGRIRYRIRKTDEGDWHETGERSGGENQWFPFFEMTMRKVR